MPKQAVILFNLGGPDTLEAIEPFLFNLFCDTDIFKMPVGQKLFAKLISRSRARKVREKYRQIGGSSPINKWTEIQRSMLQQELQKEVADVEVFTAMRYWNPMIRNVANEISGKNFDKIVLLPLYPHYSITTTGSSFNEWKRFYKGDMNRLRFVSDYFDNQPYISALNDRINEAVLRFPEKVRNDIQMIFSAHGTPESLVKKGDPYSGQIKKTVEIVMVERNFSHDYHLCFQSKVGPVKWLEPSTDKTIEALGQKNKKHLLIIPISFVSDHIETLHELDIEYRDIAGRANIENFIVMKGLNDSRLFCEALKEIALKALQESNI
jgi:ferrochelatase